MKFYRSMTEFIEQDNTVFPEYGYVTDMDVFKDTPLQEWTVNSDFIIFTEDDLIKESVIKEHDNIIKTKERFISTHTEKEQWGYYKKFLLASPSYRFQYTRTPTECTAHFDEVGDVFMVYEHNALVIRSVKTNDLLDVLIMSDQNYKSFYEELKENGQIKGETNV